MSRVPGGRRVIAGLLASSLLMALAVLPASPFHSTVIADAPDSCPADTQSSPGDPICYLHAVDVPGSVPAGQDFTFHVRVEDVDGNLVTGDECASSATIQVTLYSAESEIAPLSLSSGDSTTSDAAAGIAEFTISVASPGSYFLRAEPFQYDCGTILVSGDSDVFEVTEANSTTCGETSCDTPPITSGGGSVVVITGTGGATITAEFIPFDAGSFHACQGQKLRDPNSVLSFDVDQGSKTLTITVNGKPPIQVCWNSPNGFKQKDGKAAKFDAGLGVFFGLLADCKGPHPTGPCIIQPKPPKPKPHTPPPTTSTFTIVAPAGDPNVRW